MNSTPFPGSVTGSLPMGTMQQSSTPKIVQNLTPDSQHKLVGVITEGEGGMQYVRPLNPNAFATIAGVKNQQQQMLTVPITLPANNGTQQPQTIQIQVVYPHASLGENSAGQPKYHLAPISLGQLPQGGAKVFQTGYSQQGYDDVQMHVQPQNSDATAQTSCLFAASSEPSTRNTLTAVTPIAQRTIQQTIQIPGAPEGLTVVAQIPQDLVLCKGMADAKEDVEEGIVTTPVALIERGSIENQGYQSSAKEFISSMPASWTSVATPRSIVAEYTSRIPTNTLPLNLHQFLKLSAEMMKREGVAGVSSQNDDGMHVSGSTVPEEQSVGITVAGCKTEMISGVVREKECSIKFAHKKKYYKKKSIKPKKSKPGQVSIVTGPNGTTFFFCPQCTMAFHKKDLLEQHLFFHKIERRFICGICGAGLKRKEHLERHALVHNPERPFICSVCMKGFKRKEHLNLHLLIHSGQKTEVCEECGKGFYRRDHLRKHIRSHLAKRMKGDPLSCSDNLQNQNELQRSGTQSVSEIPQIQNQSEPGSRVRIDQTSISEKSNVVLPTWTETGAIPMLHHQQEQHYDQSRYARN